MPRVRARIGHPPDLPPARPAHEGPLRGIKSKASIISIAGDGRLVCKHGTELPYETAAVANRNGLKPRQPARESDFRVRGLCKHPTDPCAKPGLAMKHDWNTLIFYPHHAHGHAKRYTSVRRCSRASSRSSRSFTTSRAG